MNFISCILSTIIFEFMITECNKSWRQAQNSQFLLIQVSLIQFERVLYWEIIELHWKLRQNLRSANAVTLPFPFFICIMKYGNGRCSEVSLLFGLFPMLINYVLFISHCNLKISIMFRFQKSSGIGLKLLLWQQSGIGMLLKNFQKKRDRLVSIFY